MAKFTRPQLEKLGEAVSIIMEVLEEVRDWEPYDDVDKVDLAADSLIDAVSNADYEDEDS